MLGSTLLLVERTTIDPLHLWVINIYYELKHDNDIIIMKMLHKRKCTRPIKPYFTTSPSFMSKREDSPKMRSSRDESPHIKRRGRHDYYE